MWLAILEEKKMPGQGEVVVTVSLPITYVIR
jgi:hypothetical protein